MLQVTGGEIDQKDIFGENIDVEKTIKREAMEELKINLNDKESILYNRISYLYVSEDNEQPGVQLFSKAKSKMTVEEMKKYFEEYYKRNGNEWINVLVGDVQRMKLFYEKGWQIKMEIPQEVWNAYEILVKKGNYSLNQAAKNAGVKNFDKFHNSGYKGLYNGETAATLGKLIFIILI